MSIRGDVFYRYKAVSTKIRYAELKKIIDDREMTAREIETEMNRMGYSKYFDMNHVRPRLTELVKYHELIECEMREDYLTHKQVAVYRKTTEQEKMELENMNHVPMLD